MFLAIFRSTESQRTDDKIKMFITGALVLTLCLAYFHNAVNPKEASDIPLEFLTGAVGLMVGFYWRNQK
jgi:hypothetical protein